MRVVIPVAGVGSRLKPHTFTVPKPLMEVAGKPILDYIIEDVVKLDPTEIIFVVGYKRKNIEEYVQSHYSDLPISFAYQKVRDGNGSAIRVALEHIEEEDDLFVVFGDTMVDFDYKSLLKKRKDTDALILAMEVEEPSHYGIMNIKKDGEIYEVEEKPENPKSNLAIIGAYYFKSLQFVKSTLESYFLKGETVNGEYNIIQVVDDMIKDKGLSVKAHSVKKWFDCGRPSVLLEANRYFLRKMSKGSPVKRGTSLIIPPSFVAKSATVENSIIGPYASVGEGVSVSHSKIENSIISSGTSVDSVILKESLLGKESLVKGKATKLNIGERSEFVMD